MACASYLNLAAERCAPVDRNQFLPQSVCGVLMSSSVTPFKKGLCIFMAVVLAPVVLVGLAAFAAGDWRQVGATAGGDQVLVSSVTAQKNGLRTAWIRVEYKEPTKLPQGGPFVELRARVRFNCASNSAAAGVAGVDCKPRAVGPGFCGGRWSGYWLELSGELVMRRVTN